MSIINRALAIGTGIAVVSGGVAAGSIAGARSGSMDKDAVSTLGGVGVAFGSMGAVLGARHALTDHGIGFSGSTTRLSTVRAGGGVAFAGAALALGSLAFVIAND